MKYKEVYLAPECEEIELRLEGIIAASDTTVSNPFDGLFEDPWF